MVPSPDWRISLVSWISPSRSAPVTVQPEKNPNVAGLGTVPSGLDAEDNGPAALGVFKVPSRASVQL